MHLNCHKSDRTRRLSWMRVQLETRRSRIWPPPRWVTFFRGDWSWNIFYSHSLLLIQEGQLSVSGERMCTILVNHLEDWACPVNVWLGKLTVLDITALGWLGCKTSTQTNKLSQEILPDAMYAFELCHDILPDAIHAFELWHDILSDTLYAFELWHDILSDALYAFQLSQDILPDVIYGFELLHDILQMPFIHLSCHKTYCQMPFMHLSCARCPLCIWTVTRHTARCHLCIWAVW